jgi:hypothetical protein
MRWWSLVILVVSGCSGVPGIDGGVVDGGVDTGVDGGGDAGVAVPDKTSGHRTRFHWLSSGEVVHQALASEVAVTRLDDARFEFSARGEVIVRAGDSWLVSDSRQLDLDEVGELGQPDAGPPMPMVVVPITRADGGGLTGRLDYFSPDTRSFLEEHPGRERRVRVLPLPRGGKRSPHLVLRGESSEQLKCRRRIHLF